jgi:hypothetical protein
MTGCYQSIASVPPPAWAEIVAPDRLYLGADYLGALEDAAPPRLGFRYAVLDDAASARGVAAMQIVDVSPRECVPKLVEAPADEPAWRRWLRRGVAAVLADRRFRVLMCGNVFAGGESGIAWRSSREAEATFRLAADAMQAVGSAERGPSGEPGSPAAIHLFKDVGEECGDAARGALLPLGYREIEADPVMVLAVRASWRSFDDYLAALTARYRGHARRALRASAGIERRALDPAQIAAAAPDIDRLHAAVIARASICPSWLDARGFAALKARLGDRFAFVGYFDGDRLVAFNTRFHLGDDLDSHYFGVDYDVSRRYELYRSMLYDDIAAAIERGAKRVLFGRTSQEVKSSLGAVPQRMSWFGRMSSPLTTGAMARFAARFNPGAVIHDPFRLARDP